MLASRYADTPPALDIASVSHDYGGHAALTDVSFSIPRSGFCALLGPNGAGKTTLVSLLTRLHACRSGSISVFGKDLARDPGAALARLGIVFQQRSLDLDLTVMQNMHYQGALHGLPGREIRERGGEEIERIGLAEKAGTPLRQLSGGQMRRVEIARALLHRPDLLILDEPTVGLDPATRRDIHAHMLSLCETGVAVLWCTHLLDEVVPGGQLVVMDKGRVLANDTASAVLESTRTKTVEAAFEKLTGGDRRAPAGGVR